MEYTNDYIRQTRNENFYIETAKGANNEINAIKAFLDKQFTNYNGRAGLLFADSCTEAHVISIIKTEKNNFVINDSSNGYVERQAVEGKDFNFKVFEQFKIVICKNDKILYGGDQAAIIKKMP